MTIPTIVDADPDPTTQIPWPAARNKRSQEDVTAGDPLGANNAGGGEENTRNAPRKVARNRLSTWNLITLSISMAGAQIAWTVELGYGNPFLLQLGLPEQLTSLVWLAGPLSGLIMQPLIGAISDSSTSRFRRRYWIALSTVVLLVATLTLAYCRGLATLFVDLFDWDPKREEKIGNTAIGLAIVSFCFLDFALNALQASLRNLLLDITPPDQLNAGNAWHGRMTHAGNIIGFGFGFLPLSTNYEVQFRNFCLISIAILVITVSITCIFHEEQERSNPYKKKSKFRDVLENIQTAIINLPKPIRRVCFVQVFAFMGWFPFLFFSTTYIGQVMAYEQDREPDETLATRTGELAMLFYSIVAVCAGTLLPHLAGRDRRLLRHKGDVDEDAELTRLRDTVQRWKAEAARKGKPLRLPVMPFLLRNIWTGALLLFTVITFSTFFVTTVAQATVAISLVGICWAVACWVPFAIIMEDLKEIDSFKPRDLERRPGHARALSSPAQPRSAAPPPETNERQPLLRRRSFDEYETGADGVIEKKPVAGGTVLGIHNLAIVFPQFLVAIMSSVIFRIVDSDDTAPPLKQDTYYHKNGVAWVLRFGGLCTLIGAMIARMVPPTPTEKEMRRRLAEMRALQQESSS